MSADTRSLQSVFQNATEVTSLSTSDRIAVIGDNGVPKKIERDCLIGQRTSISFSQSQWIRIAEFSGTASVLLSLFNPWNNTTGSRILVDCLFHRNNINYCKATILSAMCNNGINNIVFTKLRAVVKTNKQSYIDVYCVNGGGLLNILYFDFISTFHINAITPELNAQIPEGYTVKEFDLTTVGGGG